MKQFVQSYGFKCSRHECETTIEPYTLCDITVLREFYHFVHSKKKKKKYENPVVY